MNSESTMEEMSGEGRKMPQLSLNEVRLNGQDGKFYYRNILQGKITKENGKEGYEETEIGEELKVIFLKIRRQLMGYDKENERMLRTNEHNHKSEFVTLFGSGDGVKSGYADALREQYPILRTVQVVYCLYNDELVRLRVSGSSLGSKAKPEGEHTFYSYISSFKKDNRDDHFYECYTVLYPVSEVGELGPYKAMGFKEGEKLDEKEMEKVRENMKTAHNYSLEADDYFKATNNSEIKKEAETKGKEEPGVDTGDDVEGISPEDIPFS